MTTPTCRQLTDRFADRLSKEMDHRLLYRYKMVPSSLHEGEREPAWVCGERELMFMLVNAERQALGKPLVNMKDIGRVETMACGHSDYLTKFARYCAELVLIDLEQVKP